MLTDPGRKGKIKCAAVCWFWKGSEEETGLGLKVRGQCHDQLFCPSTQRQQDTTCVCVCVSLVAGCLRLNRSPPPLAVKSHYNWDWGHLHMSTVHNCSNIWYKVQCRGFRPGMFNLLEKQSTVRVYHLGSELITDCTCDTHRKWGVLCCQSLQVYGGMVQFY